MISLRQMYDLDGDFYIIVVSISANIIAHCDPHPLFRAAEEALWPSVTLYGNVELRIDTVTLEGKVPSNHIWSVQSFVEG